MRITIINGSPKGQYSITLQSCLYLQKQHPEHEWNILNVGQKIHQLEKDFTPAREALSTADLILFSYPVYTFIVPSQLHRFIELMKNKKLRSKMGSKMNDGMIKPYKEAIEKKEPPSAQRTRVHSPLSTLLLTICLSFLAIACHNGRNTEHPINNPTTVRLTGGDSVANFNDKDSDQCTFKSNRDTNQYKKALCHLKELVVAGADIPAKVLYEATPRSESEYSIWYRLAECEWRDKGNTSIVDLEYLLRQYAEADSTDIMEAIMLFGEFTDGYVSDAVGDDYIALEKKYPAKFSALRKKRSEFWNENHDEWKKVMSE